MYEFDTVIIGGGPAGLSLAYPLRNVGQKVAVIEENKWDGTCPNRGCDPKKILLGAIEARVRSQQLLSHGVATVPEIVWPDLMRFKNSYTDSVSANSRSALVDGNIVAFDGHAAFIDEHTISIEGQKITSDKFVIATGQRPSRLGVEGDQYLLTSTDFLSLKELPQEIAFIGGGYIAFELALIAAVSGSKVHIIHHNEHPLKQFNQAGVKILIKQLEDKGVVFDFNIDTTNIEKSSQKTVIKAKDFELAVDAAFVTTGRVPNSDSLNLDQINVKTDRHGIIVNAHLQTSRPNIYAMGDVVSRIQPKLTAVATFDARYLSQELINPGKAISYPVIPTVVYGMPRLAQVGISFDDAKNNPEKYVTEDLDMTKWFTYWHLNEPVAHAWIIKDKTSNKIVGATCLSNEAETLVNYLTQIIDQGLTMDEVNSQIFLYPTEASDLKYL